MKYRFRRRLLYTLFLVSNSVFVLIPYNLALDVGIFFGWLGYILLGRYRRLAKEHLKFAFSNSKSEKDISKIARSVFINLGMGFAEIMSLPKIRRRLDSIIDAKGMDNVDRVLKEGKGAVVVSSHFGNWELLSPYFAYKGYPVNAVARPVYYEKYNEWVLFLRRSMGVNVILRTDSPKRLLALLKNNELVGMLPDQDIDSIEGVFVDFFGKKAYTPVAPVKLASAAGAPIIPIFIVRNKNRHTIVVEEPIRIENVQDKEDAILLYTQKWPDLVESYIRMYPEQWVWIHRRWKTQPALGSVPEH